MSQELQFDPVLSRFFKSKVEFKRQFLGHPNWFPFRPAPNHYFMNYLHTELSDMSSLVKYVDHYHRANVTMGPVMMAVNRYNWDYCRHKDMPINIRKALNYAESKVMNMLAPVKTSIKPLNLPGMKNQGTQRSLALSDFNTVASPGFTLKKLGFKTKKDAFEAAVYISKGVWTDYVKTGHKQKPPCDIAFRPARCEKDINKIRLVWVYPMEISALEALFAVPLINELSKIPDFPIAWSFSPWSGHHFGFHAKWHAHKTHILNTDYSSFDASVSDELIRRAFKILRSCFNFSDNSKYLHRLWDYLIDYFIRTPFIGPRGELLVKNGGVPSGSWFTNLIDSVVNMLITNALIYEI